MTNIQNFVILYVIVFYFNFNSEVNFAEAAWSGNVPLPGKIRKVGEIKVAYESLPIDQDWQITPTNKAKDPEGEVMEIKSLSSGKCVDNFSGIYESDNPIIQYPCNQSNPNQQWVKVPRDKFFLFKNIKTGKYLTNHETRIGNIAVQSFFRKIEKNLQEFTINGKKLTSKKDKKCLEIPDHYTGKEIVIRFSQCKA